MNTASQKLIVAIFGVGVFCGLSIPVENNGVIYNLVLSSIASIVYMIVSRIYYIISNRLRDN